MTCIILFKKKKTPTRLNSIYGTFPKLPLPMTFKSSKSSKLTLSFLSPGVLAAEAACKGKRCQFRLQQTNQRWSYWCRRSGSSWRGSCCGCWCRSCCWCGNWRWCGLVFTLNSVSLGDKLLYPRFSFCFIWCANKICSNRTLNSKAPFFVLSKVSCSDSTSLVQLNYAQVATAL